MGCTRLELTKKMWKQVDVLAALAGFNLGLSWLKPKWAYRGEAELSRSEAIKQAFRDCGGIYVVVALFLLVAAIVEIITLIFI